MKAIRVSLSWEAVLKITPFIAAAIVSVAATSAFAEPAQRTIQYRDLDLTSIEGQDTFAARVDAAVVGVCWQSARGTDVMECRRETREQLTNQLPHPARDALAAATRREEPAQLAQR